MNRIEQFRINRRQMMTGTTAIAGAAAASTLLPRSSSAQPPGPPSPFSDAVRDHRWAALREMMSSSGIDCLVVPTLPGDFTLHYAEYVSNTGGNGVAILSRSGQALGIGLPPRPGTWHRSVPALPGMLGGAVVDAINELGHATDNIGVVGTATGQTFGLNDFSAQGLVLFSLWNEVLSGLPDTEFVEVTPQFARVAMVKHPEEIAAHRNAAALGEELNQFMLESARPGVSDRQFRAAISQFLIMNGATADVQALEIPPGTLQDGSVINSEMGVRIDGGYAQVTLCIAIGAVSPLTEQLNEVAQECFAVGLELVGPGIRFADVIEPMEKVVADASFWHGFPVLHSLSPVVLAGPVSQAPPPQGRYTPIRGGDIVLEAGMSLSFEPGARMERRDQVKLGTSGMVTEDGFDIYNTLGRTLQRVS
ncbi:M24 family metallopeptidase [Candidatus Rariloculus sp.]|uniref:M24 family metallopeptidase n=1 Tax=Candidatus Rariloculus sp. TaxID=3101265 RepID=UPI003D0F032F